MRAKKIMSEFFLELFSEEIPTKLRVNAREQLKQIFTKFFEENDLKINYHLNVFSTPNRLIVYINRLPKYIIKKAEEIRGPSSSAAQKAIDGFIKSNSISVKQLYKKTTEKGEFYFYKKPIQKTIFIDFLKKNLPDLLNKINWKKSMRWGNYSLYWGRPLKSILAVLDKKIIKFNLSHIESSNKTFLDKELEENQKLFNDYSSYKKLLMSKGIIINNDKRKELIKNEIQNISSKNNLKIILNENLLEEVTNIVEKPKVILCEFDEKFLTMPEEILIITMRTHQKYFPTFDKKNKLTNKFFIVSDIKDSKGFVKSGNERVIEARLRDAEFFWNKNKSQNLVKQVSKLRNINYFKGIGSYFDKVQRIRKLSSVISDEFLISKEKIEIASAICKVDLMSDLVGEFPELQGVIGGYFALEQGFEKEVSEAIKEHYLPIGMDSKIPKNPYSIALSLSDKIDSLVGFFGVNLKPSSSKDPYALRRMAISIVRLILENQKDVKLKDLINYSCMLFKEQGYNFDSKKILKDLSEFIIDRFKYYLKEKNIRNDIVESSILNLGIDVIFKSYKKIIFLNKNLKKENGVNAIAIYKRTSNILESEKYDLKDFTGSVDPGLFNNDYEAKLYAKIHSLRKYLSSIGSSEDYNNTLVMLSDIKPEVDNFFDNVKVNDDENLIKKNRLELLKMLCKSFDNYFNFSKIEL